jgi:hypothetical protein
VAEKRRGSRPRLLQWWTAATERETAREQQVETYEDEVGDTPQASDRPTPLVATDGSTVSFHAGVHYGEAMRELERAGGGAFQGHNRSSRGVQGRLRGRRGLGGDIPSGARLVRERLGEGAAARGKPSTSGRRGLADRRAGAEYGRPRRSRCSPGGARRQASSVREQELDMWALRDSGDRR